VEAGDGYDEIEKAMDDAHHKAGSRKKLPRVRGKTWEISMPRFLLDTHPRYRHIVNKISGVLAFEILLADFGGVIGNLPQSRLSGFQWCSSSRQKCWP
jgi:hypothetical protein